MRHLLGMLPVRGRPAWPARSTTACCPNARKWRSASIILAPGFSPYDPSKHEYYAYAKHPNVVTALEMERILSASGPFRAT